jgi:acetyl-CoA carboxylase biotin carboxyl carrier protein
MDIRKVKKLIELLEESGIGEIEIHEGEESVRVSRFGGVAPVPPGNAAPVVAGSALSGEAEAAAAKAGESAGDELPEGHVVKAPMVGIFYASSAPGKPPFVETGQSVNKGEVLCIIEAMKIMNQIEADASGTIARVLVENGDPVEYGQPLFVIRPA